ncbi:hypothetical protein P154DRAFT_525882 [Amniculicola lignicola CBS 123094]|uniref:Uncharacterized protein n=1 Tax=Amniculicola lignicola CBS 123094 TaxID=1392246 RepID=A0A6A5W5D1_9PLEO|nr:hypothetical protein P154DRAFT_525882 [Amniculicola lignicola CBS 123094]
MHSSKLLVLFAAAVTAQSTVEVLNLYDDAKTLISKGSDKTATTYENICTPTSRAPGQASSSLAEISSPPAESSATPTPSPSDLSLVPITTIPARLRRQSPGDDAAECDPYTIIQGNSSWQFHLTDAGALTINADCSWSGAMTTASLTCVATREGSAFPDPGVSSTVLNPGEIASSTAIVAAVIVTTTPAPSGTPSASGNGTSNATFTRTPTVSHTDLVPLSGSGAPQSSSTGMAAALALPTGAAAFVGGAAGLLVAALAL